MLATMFGKAGVDLVRVEAAAIRLNPEVRRAIRAHARLQMFERALAIWRQVAPQQRALLRARAPLEQIAALNRFRPPYYAPDHRGRYAWARRELLAEYRTSWPRSRRTDVIQARVIAAVQSAILLQLYPEYEPGRDIDRGLPSAVRRLTVRFLRAQFPFLAEGVTVHSLGNRTLRLRSN